MAIDLRDGIYKGRGVEGSEQYGEKNGNLELIVDVVVQVPADGAKPAHTRSLSTAHYMTQAAAQYVFERLRALGWEGNDIRDLRGISKNEIDVQVKTEDYQGKPVTKVEILSGGGRFKSATPVDKNAFAAKLQAIIGGPVPGPGAVTPTTNPTPPTANNPKPPF
jgi:hypothetical protein